MITYRQANARAIGRAAAWAAVIGALFGAIALSLPLGLATFSGSSGDTHMALQITAKLGLLGALYGITAGAMIGGMVALSMIRSGKPYLMGLATGILWGILAELLTWHHIEGFLVMLGGVSGLVIALILSRFQRTKHERPQAS